MAEFVLDFLRAMCERDIFGVDPEQEQKGILISVVQPARDDFFYTKTHTHPRVCCKTTHTLKHARREKERERERERERGDDDADDGAYYYYYYYFCSFR